MSTATSTAQRLYTATELAAALGTTARALRFYESRGLLSPRRAGNRRVYDHRDRGRLALILRGKRLGFSLKEIAEILGLYDSAPGEAGQLWHLLDKIGERRDQLIRQREDIAVTLAELETLEARCKHRLAELARN